MENLSDLIRNARKAKGLTQAEVADLYGSGQTTVSEWEKGKVTQIRNWERLADILDIDRDVFLRTMTESTALVDGIQRMSSIIRLQMDGALPAMGATAVAVSKSVKSPPTFYGGGPVNTPVVARSFPHMNARDVPVYGRAQGGPAGEFEFNGEIMGWESRPPMLEGVPDAYAIYVDGDSMFPRYKPGETVWMNPSKPPSRGDDVIVQLHPKEEHGPFRGFIKEFVKWSPNHLVVYQHNPAGELTYERDDVKTMHTIVFSQK